MVFVKGDPNINRKGRPVDSLSVVGAIKEKLLQVPKGSKKRYLDLLVSAAFKKAIRGRDVAMIRDIIDRIDGKPKQNLDMTSNGETLGLQMYVPKKNG